MKPFTAILLFASFASAQFYIRDQKYRFQADEPECSIHGFCAYEEHRSGDNHDFSINYIEIKGDGTLFDSRQLSNALDRIEAATFRDPATGIPRQKPLVFVYVHGWHNNADERNNTASSVCPDRIGDVAKFRDCGLPMLASDYPTKPGAPPSVVGIYLAWQGTDFTLLGGLTYYIPSYMLRRYAANHVGQTGVCDAVGQILGKASDRGQYVAALMGHSFGARVLENAIQIVNPHGKCSNNLFMQYRNLIEGSSNQRESPAMAAAVVNAHAPADLVFYVNAAAPDTFTQKTIDIWNQTCSKALRTAYAICSADPFYLSATSRTDIATGLVMPIANIAFFWFPLSLRPPRFELTPLSAANTPWMHTHHDPKNLKHQPCPPEPHGICFPVTVTSRGSGTSIENYDVKPRKDRTHFFWILNFGSAFSRNHGDVWNPKVFDLVQALLKRNANYIDGRIKNLVN